MTSAAGIRSVIWVLHSGSKGMFWRESTFRKSGSRPYCVSEKRTKVQGGDIHDEERSLGHPRLYSLYKSNESISSSSKRPVPYKINAALVTKSSGTHISMSLGQYQSHSNGIRLCAWRVPYMEDARHVIVIESYFTNKAGWYFGIFENS